MDKPVLPERIKQYTPSYAELGIIAQKGCLIEIRTPDPTDSKAPWPRIWLTPKAALTLMDWLPRAIDEQEVAMVVPVGDGSTGSDHGFGSDEPF